MLSGLHGSSKFWFTVPSQSDAGLPNPGYSATPYWRPAFTPVYSSLPPSLTKSRTAICV